MQIGVEAKVLQRASQVEIAALLRIWARTCRSAGEFSEALSKLERLTDPG